MLLLNYKQTNKNFMKTLENLNGIQLYENTDSLPERFTNNNITRLTVGKTYNIVGLCRVPESKNSAGEKINAWDGVLLENNATGKQFPVSVNSLFAIGFYRKNPNAKAEIRRPQITSPFATIEDILSTETFNVIGSEKVEITDFSGKVVMRDFYHFGEIVSLPKNKIPTFATAKVEAKTGKSKK